MALIVPQPIISESILKNMGQNLKKRWTVTQKVFIIC